MPVAVPGLKIVSTGSERPPYKADWDSSELGLRWQCSIDGSRLTPCSQGLPLDLPEGEHRLAVGAIDPSGSAGPLVNAFYTVVDTVLRSGPADGATVAAANFAVDSRSAREYECAIDGGAFAACARSANPTVTLPALPDGPHTVRIRGRAGDWVDASPISRSFKLDHRSAHDAAQDRGRDGVQRG